MVMVSDADCRRWLRIGLSGEDLERKALQITDDGNRITSQHDPYLVVTAMGTLHFPSVGFPPFPSARMVS